MDRNRAHDVIHIWHGNKTENCPVCKGEMSSDEDILSCAKDIAAQNYHPQMNPNLGPQEAIWCNDKPAVAPADVKAGEKPTSRAFSVMTDVMSFSEGADVPKRIKIIPTGKFNTAKYGELEITKDDLLEMAQNFYAGARAGGALTGLPIDIEHGETSHRDAAAGWIKNIVVMDDGAYADVDWTELGKDLLEKGIYKFYSPEFTFEYVDNETSTEISNVVIGGGLVNKPLFDHSLPPLMMSEDAGGENLTKNSAPHTIVISNQTTLETPVRSSTTAILTTLDAVRRSTIPVLTTLERPVTSTTALLTNLERVTTSTVALVATLESGVKRSTTGVLTTLDRSATGTTAVLTTLETNGVASTVAIRTVFTVRGRSTITISHGKEKVTVARFK